MPSIAVSRSLPRALPWPPRLPALPELPSPSRRIRPYDLCGVTRVGAEVEPGEVGLRPEQIGRIWERVRELYATREHPAIALCIRRRGRVVVDRTIGHVRGNHAGHDDAPPTIATPDSLFNLFSASKSVTAIVIHLLAERGRLRLEDRVADHVPEVGAEGPDRGGELLARDVHGRRPGPG